MLSFPWFRWPTNLMDLQPLERQDQWQTWIPVKHIEHISFMLMFLDIQCTLLTGVRAASTARVQKPYLFNPKRGNWWIGASPGLSWLLLISSNVEMLQNNLANWIQLEACNWPQLGAHWSPSRYQGAVICNSGGSRPSACEHGSLGIWWNLVMVSLPCHHCCSLCPVGSWSTNQKNIDNHDNCGKNHDEQIRKGAASGWQQTLTNTVDRRNPAPPGIYKTL